MRVSLSARINPQHPRNSNFVPDRWLRHKQHQRASPTHDTNRNRAIGPCGPAALPALAPLDVASRKHDVMPYSDLKPVDLGPSPHPPRAAANAATGKVNAATVAAVASPLRNVQAVVLGDTLFRTWYPSFYPEELVAPETDRLHVCRWCFKYAADLERYLGHTVRGVISFLQISLHPNTQSARRKDNTIANSPSGRANRNNATSAPRLRAG